jgi:hypothetical protein
VPEEAGNCARGIGLVFICCHRQGQEPERIHELKWLHFTTFVGGASGSSRKSHGGIQPHHHWGRYN